MKAGIYFYESGRALAQSDLHMRGTVIVKDKVADAGVLNVKVNDIEAVVARQ